MTILRSYSTAAELPAAWNGIAAGNPFLQRDSLNILEDVNPCGQRYYLAGEGTEGSIAVTYRHKLNVLTFWRSQGIRIPVTVIGCPLSVGEPGYVFGDAASGMALRHHLATLAGITLVLNAEAGASWPGWNDGLTLPGCRLVLPADGGMSTWLASFRSSYRRRIRQAQSRWEGVAASRLLPSEFGLDYYALYRSVWQRSAFQLECQPVDFFQRFPARITGFKMQGHALGFIQTVRDGGTLYFLFGGMDYALRDRYDVYWNLLLAVIAEAFEEGCHTVELGQTAELAKQRLGGQLVARHLHARHANKAVNKGLRMAARCLSYRPPEGGVHVFRR
ncbi:MAG TPA: hypothetical protein DCS43_10535 [Verrucomicrobia bacterium]|nr:hypothetical protein [Verrucomicrobiota bacterium]